VLWDISTTISRLFTTTQDLLRKYLLGSGDGGPRTTARLLLALVSLVVVGSSYQDALQISYCGSSYQDAPDQPCFCGSNEGRSIDREDNIAPRPIWQPSGLALTGKWFPLVPMMTFYASLPFLDLQFLIDSHCEK
jgi:hypothetical protein